MNNSSCQISSNLENSQSTSAINYFQTSLEYLFDYEDNENMTQDEFITNILTLFSQYFDTWKSYTSSDFVCSRTSLAMTNRVYFLSLKSPSSSSQDVQKILVRLYGKSNIIIQRDKEMEIAKILSSKQLAPKWYLSFSNGRIEEYLNCLPVTAPLFRSLPIACQISNNLAKIHKLLPDLVSGGIFPAENHIWRLFDARRQYASDGFQILLRHYQQLLDNTNDSRPTSLDLSTTHTPLSMLLNIQSWNPFHSEKVEMLKENILKVNSPLVYAHCDVHHGNVIKIKPIHGNQSTHEVSPSNVFKESDEPLQTSIIDFEYGIPTGRGYDLANLFCEFCGDYDSRDNIPAHEMNFSLYPNEDARRLIFQSYCQVVDDDLDKLPNDKEVESLELEVRAHLPLVHLQWAHWGIIKASDEVQRGIPLRDDSFDYLRYAYQRYSQWYQEMIRQQHQPSTQLVLGGGGGGGGGEVGDN